MEMVQKLRELLLETANICFVSVYQSDGRYVNDHCFIFDGSNWHCFYIDGTLGMGCYDEGNEIQIGHATSSDLSSWQYRGSALIRDIGLPHERRGIFAPYVVERDGEYLMYYASHNQECAQYMCLARSDDLFAWTRCEANPLFIPSAQWALWREDIPCSNRDAHVFFDANRSRYLLYWVADMKCRADLSCIAASESLDMVHWQELGPVLVRRHSAFESYTMKTESPCVVYRHGRYFLFYRHGDGTYYCMSDDPVDFTYSNSYYLGPCHAAEVFEHDGCWYVSSCSRDVCDLRHATDRSRGLYLACLVWEDIHPEIVPFAPATSRCGAKGE